MSKIELLLPAGNWDCLKAAVENGADAVYFGVDRFNARRRANNFHLEEVREVVDYCHKNGVRAYCTLNTLIKNSEIKDFFQVIKQLYLFGIDAVIIQEISFLPIIKTNFPGMEVHISTQAAITNSYAAELVKTADRVILPREFSQEEIKQFIQNTKLPTEIFVQGALCFSYSGKCLFSSFLGGRSGNRGFCAQPCRRLYNGKYLLSMKDLCLIEKIPEIINIGVSTIKIEGRLRSVRYVAAAAKAYRTAIDSYYQGKFAVPETLVHEMKLAFNREFTTSYFTSEQDLVASEQPMGRGLFLGVMEKNNLLHLENNLAVGDGLGLWSNNKVDGAVLKKMERDGVSIKEARKGDLVKLYIRVPEGTKIFQTSSLKQPERITSSQNKPITTAVRKEPKMILPHISEQISSPELLVKVYSAQDVAAAKAVDADKVFYNLFAADFPPDCDAFVPRILTDAEVETALAKISKMKIKNILVGDLGVYAQLKKSSLNIYLDYSNNIFNDYDLQFFKEATTIISPELSFQELREFQNKNFAVLVHGKVILMNIKYSQLPAQLKDEKNYTFPVRKEQSYYQILNSRELGLFEEVNKLQQAGMNQFFLDLEHNVTKTIILYKNILNHQPHNINKKGYTKGHFAESVL